MLMRKTEERRKRKGKKSYYYKFFLSFIMVLFVPMLTIALIFISSQRIIRGQILKASENTLNQFFRRVDDVLNEAQEVCITIVNSSDSKTYSKKLIDQFDKRAFCTREIQQQLKSYIGEKYQDIFEYYPEKDYVISANYAAVNLEAYYKLYYADEEDDFPEEFERAVKTSRKKPVLFGMNTKGSRSYLCLSMKQVSYQDEKYDYVLVAVLRPEYVSELLENVVDGEQNGISMILNSGGEKIFSTDQAVYEEAFEEEQYKMQRQQSKVTDVSYVYAVPYSYFWSKLFTLYIICGVGTAVSLILGILVIFRQADKMYQPVDGIVKELQKQVSLTYDAGINTEFEFIKNTFDKEKREKLDMNRTIRQGERARRTNFILSIVNGSNEVSETADDIFVENGIELCSDYFCVALLCLEQEQSMESKLTAFVVTNVFEELCSNMGKGYVVELNNKEFVILVNPDTEADKDKLLPVLEKGIAILGRYRNMNLTIGLSNVREGLQGIHIACEEARRALRYSYLLGKKRVIAYSEIEKRTFRYLRAPELKMQHVVSEYLTGEEEKDTLKLVVELLTDYEIDKEASLETVECFAFEAVSMFHRCLMQEGLWTERWREKIMHLLDEPTLEMFQVYFADLLRQLKAKKQEIAGEQDVCAGVKEYIEQHYGEEQLSRVLLSDLFGVAPGYLSKMFKEKYQFTIPEYIAGTRIDHAKQQLRNTEKNVSEIAQENGFVNSASFIRTFKRQEGITPNVYREYFLKRHKTP